MKHLIVTNRNVGTVAFRPENIPAHEMNYLAADLFRAILAWMETPGAKELCEQWTREDGEGKEAI